MRFGTAVASLAVLSLSLFAATCRAADPSPTDLEGKPAPDFSLKTAAGKNVTLSETKGNVVVLDFWATWCPPCRESLPHLQKLSADTTLARKGLVVWAVNAEEENGVVQKFLADNNYTFTVPMGTGKVAADYNVAGIPTTVIVGRDGKVRKTFVGYGEGSEGLMDEAVKAALAEKE